MPDEKFYYIVNPKGCMHIVTEEHAKTRLKLVGWRLATAEERAAYENKKGNQRADKPLATPFTPMPADIESLNGAEYVPPVKDEVAIAEAVQKVKSITPKKSDPKE